MRLFIAINFDETTKNRLCDIIGGLREQSLSGNFTRLENLHVTLHFLGETNRVNDIKAAMDAVTVEPFDITMQGFGGFNQRGSMLYWVGIGRSDALRQCHRQLYDALSESGFELDSRPFKPHLTIGREVETVPGFDRCSFAEGIKPFCQHVGRISLMKSERIRGVLTYTEVYGKNLG